MYKLFADSSLGDDAWAWPLYKRFLLRYHLIAGKIRRGNYVFITWKGDHSPHHVHVYREGRFVVKWDLQNEQAMKGKATARILSLISELKEEGRL